MRTPCCKRFMRARLTFFLLVPSLALAANYEVPLTDVEDEGPPDNEVPVAGCR